MKAGGQKKTQVGNGRGGQPVESGKRQKDIGDEESQEVYRTEEEQRFVERRFGESMWCRKEGGWQYCKKELFRSQWSMLLSLYTTDT